MIEVVSVKFRGKGKSYFFDPCGKEISAGDKVIVETSKGLEIADCCRGNHPVPEDAVVQPLRPVIRIADESDIRTAANNVRREKEAFDICKVRIAEHGLDMKLVDVECSFDGSKTTFFFTSDGRVDFRELVKDLASIFRNRIELRQIGVRDEAKMIGGIGICGRPYCCRQFLDDFQPVSTKMAKVQSLSLNPTKISGSCGRLMCCLRYEEDAYEDLVKKVPKQGAFVETKDGFGTAVQVNLLRQTVKVRLDSDNDDSLHLYKANELCAVPGGRPKDGEQPVSTFVYVPEEEEKEETVENEWSIPELFADAAPAAAETGIKDEETDSGQGAQKKSQHRNRKNHHVVKAVRAEEKENRPEKPEKTEKPAKPAKPANSGKPEGVGPAQPKPNGKHKQGKNGGHKPDRQPVPAAAGQQPKEQPAKQDKPRPPKPEVHTAKEKQVKAEMAPAESAPANGEAPKKKSNYRRYYHHHKPSAKKPEAK